MNRRVSDTCYPFRAVLPVPMNLSKSVSSPGNRSIAGLCSTVPVLPHWKQNGKQTTNSLEHHLCQKHLQVLSLRCHPMIIKNKKIQVMWHGPRHKTKTKNQHFVPLITDSVSFGSRNASSASLSRHTLQAGGSLSSGSTSRSDGSLLESRNVTQGDYILTNDVHAPPTERCNKPALIRDKELLNMLTLLTV